MNDYRLYKITIGCDLSAVERSYKVVALEPLAAVDIAINLARKDNWPQHSVFAAVNIKLADNRVKN